VTASWADCGRGYAQDVARGRRREMRDRRHYGSAANVRRQRRAKRVRCTPGLGNGMGGKARTCARQRCRAVAGVLKNRAEGGSDARAGSPGGGQMLS